MSCHLSLSSPLTRVSALMTQQNNRLLFITSTLAPIHKVLTYVEYRAVSGVFQNIDLPPPLHPASVTSSRTKGGGYTLAGR